MSAPAFDLISYASLFASDAHKGQTRKYTGEPYVMHTRSVADIVSSVACIPVAIAAAHLHDVIEDTGVTHRDILNKFGMVVSDLVFWLTRPNPSDGSSTRRERNLLCLAHIAKAPALAQTIKLADIIDNVRTIATLDPGFARIYLPENEAMLAVIDRADARLMARAHTAINEAWARMPGLGGTGRRSASRANAPGP